jgi:hypothetical protein
VKAPVLQGLTRKTTTLWYPVAFMLDKYYGHRVNGKVSSFQWGIFQEDLISPGCILFQDKNLSGLALKP